jgi:membrane-associated phospholipid phosphatase
MLGLAALALLAGCDKQIEEYAPAPSARTAVDANGGNWKTFLIGSPAGIEIGTPTATSSGEYAAELAALKNAMAGATDAQKNAAGYWNAGGVLRWNQIARELVAKYNLAPVNNEDNTYPVPDQNNPTAYPKFPFANPPYASRAYALLSVAQYDALVAAWHYKYQFNRPAPYAVDGSIKPLQGGSELPSYPSEDAVVAAASAEVLKFLFPGEVEMLAGKAREHADSRLWAGTNVQSDLDAGAAIGRAVAQKVLAHARADGMRTAGGADWKAMEAACVARGEMPWKSMDSPARPPMLPGFGTIKTWNFGAAEVEALRPPPPPRTDSPEFRAALSELKHYSRSATRDQIRIIHYWADGVGTYTPPGHWNAIAEELIRKNGQSELRTARTLALLNTALMDAGVCCWDTKFHYYLPRPSQVDPEIKTLTGLPNFPAYTSGHSTFSGAAATVLAYVFPDERPNLDAMASEASSSRLYGAIHYRFDCEVGLKCGQDIGAYAVKRGQADGAQ